MTKYFCTLACVPVRRGTAGSSEMVTQLLYGEAYQILESRGDWHLIRSERDGYEGFISDAQHDGEIAPDGFRYPVTERFSVLDGQIFPMGALIHTQPTDKAGDLCTQAHKLLGSPYLWGGKTFMGIDCSALVQVAMFSSGKVIPRDSALQFLLPAESILIEQSMRNDLVFFKNEQGRIYHVGIVFEPGLILHASGSVRKDRLDEKGIYRERTRSGGYTHREPLVRRLL